MLFEVHFLRLKAPELQRITSRMLSQQHDNQFKRVSWERRVHRLQKKPPEMKRPPLPPSPSLGGTAVEKHAVRRAQQVFPNSSETLLNKP